MERPQSLSRNITAKQDWLYLLTPKIKVVMQVFQNAIIKVQILVRFRTANLYRVVATTGIYVLSYRSWQKCPKTNSVSVFVQDGSHARTMTMVGILTKNSNFCLFHSLLFHPLSPGFALLSFDRFNLLSFQIATHIFWQISVFIISNRHPHLFVICSSPSSAQKKGRVDLV